MSDKTVELGPEQEGEQGGGQNLGDPPVALFAAQAFTEQDHGKALHQDDGEQPTVDELHCQGGSGPGRKPRPLTGPDVLEKTQVEDQYGDEGQRRRSQDARLVDEKG